MSLKIHLRAKRPRLTACNLIDPMTPREAVKLTANPEIVTCGACRRTSTFFIAREEAREHAQATD